jgi:hypothetical protein
MTHTDVRNANLYADRTVQDWHRDALPAEASAMDLDLMGFCGKGYCRAPVYFIEATTNTENKATTVTRALARATGAPAYLAFHKDGKVIGGRRIHPDPATYDTPELLAAELARARHAHMTTHQSQ